MGLNDDFWGVLGVPTSMVGLVMEMMLFVMPIWTAFLVGLFIGWAWRPSWWPKHKFDSFVSKFGVTCKGHSVDDVGVGNKGSIDVHHSVGVASGSSSRVKDKDHPLVNDDDLAHLCRLVEVKDGGPSWIQMMDRSTPTMSYKAWRRDPEVGPPQYRSSTIFEDATPEMVRDFFWDDEFRSRWDNMLIHSHTIEECHATGTMIVQWVRKFPFFCSDREYIIGRRIWDSGRTFYCVTKGVPNSSIPQRDKPRRVDLYYSSWCIRAVESKRGTGQMTACEVLLFHHEDMGIPWEIAKLGVRQGMWGAVKKIDPGLRAYQKARATDQPLSNSAIIAQMPTKVSPRRLISLMNDENQVVPISEEAVVEEKKEGMNIPKFLVFGGAAVLACSLDRGLLTKAVIFGVARKIGRMGGKL